VTYIEQALREFCQGGRNQWITGPNFDVYVRAGYHSLNGVVCHTLDVANIQVRREDRGQGIGMSILAAAELVNPWDAVYVESVLNPRLKLRLERDGWIMVRESIPPCFYRMKTP